MKNKPVKRQNFEYAATILLLSTVLVKVIGALFKIPLKQLIGTLGFGYFSSAYDLFLPIYALSMAGLPVAVSRIVAEEVAAEKYKQVKKTLSIAKKAFLTTGLVGFVAMIIATYPYAVVTTKTQSDALSTAICVLCIAPALLFCCIMSAYRGYYEGLRNMFPTAISDVIEALGKLILGFGFAFVVLKITGRVEYAAAGALFGIMVGAALGMLYLIIRHKIRGDGISQTEILSSPQSDTGKKILKSLVVIAVPVVLCSLATNITLLIDTTMIRWQLKIVMTNHWDYISAIYANSIADYNANNAIPLTAENFHTFLYGIRGEAYTLFNLIPTITSVLGVGAIPVLTTSWIKKDKPLIKKNIESILRTTSLIAMPAGFGLAALCGKIMKMLYRDVASVEIGGVIMFILGITAVFAGLAIPITSMLQAIGKQNIPVRNIAIGAVLKVIVNFLLVGRPSINIKGAPVGTAVCYIFIFVSNLYCIVKYSGVRPDFMSTMIKPFISALFCAVAAFASSELFALSVESVTLVTAASIIVGGIVYVLSLSALKAITREDVIAFPKGERIADILEKLKLIR